MKYRFYVMSIFLLTITSKIFSMEFSKKIKKFANKFESAEKKEARERADEQNGLLCSVCQVEKPQKWPYKVTLCTFESSEGNGEHFVCKSCMDQLLVIADEDIANIQCPTCRNKLSVGNAWRIVESYDNVHEKVIDRGKTKIPLSNVENIVNSGQRLMDVLDDQYLEREAKYNKLLKQHKKIIKTNRNLKAALVGSTLALMVAGGFLLKKNN